jgi:nitrogen fixation/metabolism regulation signal transduction histidine kinase
VPPETLPNLPDAEDREPKTSDDGGDPPAEGDTEGGPLAEGETEGGPEQPPDEPPEPPTAPEGDPDSSSAIPNTPEEAKARLRKILGLIAWDQREFEELLVMDAEGRVIASTFEDHEGHTAENLEYFRQGRKATYLQPVFSSPITERLTMVIATPIRDSDHQTFGVLAARLTLDRFFRLLSDVTGLDKTGETVVGKKIESEVVFMAPTRHDADAALTRRIAVGSEQAKALQQAARGQEGSGEAMDYRGVEVLAAWKHIPALDWGLVVKQDREEAMQEIDQLREATYGLAAIVILLATLASIIVSRAFVGSLRQLQQATEKISRGDFDVVLNIQSRDEVGELADSFDRMVAAIKFFREHSRLEDEEDLETSGEPLDGDSER